MQIPFTLLPLHARLPELSAKAGQPWDANMLLRFGEDCLAWMARHGAATPGQHLRFWYDPQTQTVRCQVVQGIVLPARLHTLLQQQGVDLLGAS